jgi:hypothetical protein
VSYDSEELQIGILETFASTVALNRYRTSFGELPARTRKSSVGSLGPRTRKSKARVGLLGPGINTQESWKKMVAARIRRGHVCCPHCGANAPSHRCPVYIVGVST